jgi:mono/diheme cytochrome c family protein
MWRTNLKVLLLAVAVVGFYTMVAHIIPQLESEVPEALDLSGDLGPEALVAAGERVYQGAGGCGACHGLGTQAPNLLTDHAGQGTIGARCGSREPGKDCKAYLWESLTQPGAYVVDGFGNIMPDMRRQLPADQIWALVAFLQAQGGEVTVTGSDLATAASAAPAAPAAPAGLSATEPRQLLQEATCLACHAIDGAGPPIGPPFDGVGSRLTADGIRRAILDPAAEVTAGYEQFAAMMPRTFGQQLSAQQLEAIVQFLAARQ